MVVNSTLWLIRVANIAVRVVIKWGDRTVPVWHACHKACIVRQRSTIEYKLDSWPNVPTEAFVTN